MRRSARRVCLSAAIIIFGFITRRVRDYEISQLSRRIAFSLLLTSGPERMDSQHHKRAQRSKASRQQHADTEEKMDL
jgi:hypothetical protein